MKKILAIAAVLTVMAGSFAQAAPLLSSVQSAGNPQVYSVYVHGDNLNGAFDTIIFSAVPTAGTQFSSVNTGSPAAPRAAGDPTTFINRMLDADGSEIPGVLRRPRRRNQHGGYVFAFTAVQLVVDTPPPAPLAVVNFCCRRAGGGNADVELVNAGTVAFESTIPIAGVIPEPASVGLIGIAMLGLAAARRRFVA